MGNDVSLIMTVYNEAKNIKRFLESYHKQTKMADEVIIVDGGSDDETPRIIHEYAQKFYYLNIKLIIDPTCSKKLTNGPIAKGRNVAISNAKYDIIAVTDAGCLLDDNWFEEITKPFQDESVDVVAGWYESINKNEFQKKYAEIFLPTLQMVDPQSFLPSSRSIAFKKKCWNKVNGYPEYTYTAEDTKFDIDLKKVGCKFYFNEEAIVRWESPKSFEEAREKHFDYNFGDGQYRFKFMNRLKVLLGLFIPIYFIFDKQFKVRKHIVLKYFLCIYEIMGYFSGLLIGIDYSKPRMSCQLQPHN